MGNFRSLITLILLLFAHAIVADEKSGKQVWTEDTIKAELEKVEELRGQGLYDQGLELAEKLHDAAARLENVELELEARYQIGLLHYFKLDFAAARTSLKIGLTRAGLEGYNRLKADFLTAEGVIDWKQGNLTIATEKLAEALEMHRANGQLQSMISTTNNLGIIAYSQKDYLGAAGYYRLGLEWLEDTKNDRLKASLTSNLAESLIPLNQLEEAEALLHESLAIEKELGEPQGLAYTYLNFGELRSKQERHEEAISYYNQALRIQSEIGDDWGSCLTQLRRAKEFAKTGNTEEALGVLNAGMTKAKSLNALTIIADYAHELQDLHRAQGNDGLATYYHDLGDWTRERMQEESELEVAESSPEDQATDETTELTAAGIPVMQTVTLLVLAGLIVILLLENMRLRKKARSL